ncbi:chitinase-3-like protein 2 [Rhipicephalus microplus]|uniref:chitinase-3-like protein 2 n=1 Tax=Rhipicephalus microplus TaxID=6941 RepID=UPI003F6D982D
MSRRLEDEEWLIHQSLPKLLASQRRDPFIKTCITYSGAACVGFTLLLIGVFVCVIAYDVRRTDGHAVAVFPVKVRSLRRGPVPILCHVNVARFYDNDVRYRTVDLPGNYCSHLVLPLRGFFSGTNETPDASLAFGLVQSRLIELRNEVNKSFPHLKYLISVGDENGGGSRLTFHETPNATAYMTFVVEMVRWVLHNRFHGIVLNRVFPIEKEHQRHMRVFLSHLKQVMHKHGLLFVVTASSHTGIFKSGARPGRLSRFLDYVGVMTQGLHHPANATDRILIPLHHQRERKGRSVEDFVENVISSGLPRSRVLLAVSLSGFVCTMSRLPENKEVPRWIDTHAVRVLSYKEACQLIRQTDWTLSYDRESEKPHAWRNNVWIGYEDEISVRKMASLVDKMFLGGVIILDVGNDDHSGRCGPTNPLVRAIFTEVEGTPIDDNSTAIIPSFNLTDSDVVRSLNKTSGKAEKEVQ